jgi:hypothetical protein
MSMKRDQRPSERILYILGIQNPDLNDIAEVMF